MMTAYSRNKSGKLLKVQIGDTNGNTIAQLIDACRRFMIAEYKCSPHGPVLICVTGGRKHDAVC